MEFGHIKVNLWKSEKAGLEFGLDAFLLDTLYRECMLWRPLFLRMKSIAELLQTHSNLSWIIGCWKDSQPTCSTDPFGVSCPASTEGEILLLRRRKLRCGALDIPIESKGVLSPRNDSVLSGKMRVLTPTHSSLLQEASL